MAVTKKLSDKKKFKMNLFYPTETLKKLLLFLITFVHYRHLSTALFAPLLQLF